MQHFATSLRKAPPNLHAEGLDWTSFPEIVAFTYPDHFDGSKHSNGKLVLELKEIVCLVSEWVITSTDVRVRLKYGQSGCPSLWEGVQDYSTVLKAEPQEVPFIYTYVVPISVMWYVDVGSYYIQIDHLLPDGGESEFGLAHFDLVKKERSNEV